MAAFFDLGKLKDLLQRSNLEKKYPKHVLINLFPAVFGEQTIKEDLKKFYELISSIIALQVEYGIPIFTISLGTEEDLHQDSLASFCETLLSTTVENRMNVTIFGKWYDLKGILVEAMKRVNSETKGFDRHFLNLCINYDGQQELADASKVLLKKALLEKIKPEDITI